MPTPSDPSASRSETRQFRMHPKLLFDVIQRQAGKLSKAILEGVMNAADAKATKIEITVDKDEVLLVDDGQGFPSREAITTFFEVFGQPHEEAEGKIYGTFRMGRGQLFAYGANAWRTGNFLMEVDIQHCGLDYELREVPEHHPGCSIRLNLYEPLLPSQCAEVERDIALWAKYVPLKVYFNGQLISIDPAKEKWTHETEEAYIRLRKGGSVSVYNLGVHVMEVPGYQYGTGGVVVSKKQLKVNFARNDVQSTCPVWRKITPLLNQMALDAMKKTPLDDAGRQRLVDRILRREATPEEIRTAKVITLVNGRHLTIEGFLRSSKFTVAPRGDRIGGVIQDSQIALVLSQETLTRFHVDTGDAFATLLKSRQKDLSPWGFPIPPFEPYEALAEGFDTDMVVLPEKSLTPRERVWVDLLSRVSYSFTRCRAGGAEQRDTRRIVIGECETTTGWTDGATFVAINRAWLNQRELDVRGLTEVALLLTHSFTHEDSTSEGCDHEMSFYEDYHHNTVEVVPRLIAEMLDKFPQVLRTHGRRMTKPQAKALDRAARVELDARKLPKDERPDPQDERPE